MEMFLPAFVDISPLRSNFILSHIENPFSSNHNYEINNNLCHNYDIHYRHFLAQAICLDAVEKYDAVWTQ